VSGEREREETTGRLQELLETELDEAERLAVERWAAADADRAGELDRLRRLDALLAEAVPEPWSTERTDRVLAAVLPPPRPVRLVRGLLSAAAAAAALLLWGGPVLGAVQGAPERGRAFAGELLGAVASAAGDLPSLPAAPLAAAAGAVLLLTVALGARTARSLNTMETTRDRA